MGNHVSTETANNTPKSTNMYEQSLDPSAKQLSWDMLFGQDDPLDLCCPITQELFKDPVLLVNSGHTYEREAIEQWLTGERRRTDPITGQTLSEFVLVPNFAVRKAVDLWRKCKQRLMQLNDVCYQLQGQKSHLASQLRVLEQQNMLLKAALPRTNSEASSTEFDKLHIQQQYAADILLSINRAPPMRTATSKSAPL
eukprot:TRINITY_DN509_c0_g1_i2.p2 TRINITY_DN509_c0_g1~~TRINITY_DN509_c0_g1_i2.p2  ORF type:complete len:197 (-),score=23.19 TRINITY_DN509_c0_g1_i2:2489-3079(-)